MTTVLTIAGFDPSSGAGVTADLMVFAAHGLFGTSCITALTIQSTKGVSSTHPVFAEIVHATIQTLQADLPPSGIKIGMLANSDNTHVISDLLEQLHLSHLYSNQAHTSSATSSIATGAGRHSHIPVVLDPVLRATSGRELIDADGFASLRDRLLPLVDWVTPNLAELAALTGIPIVSHEDLPRASRVLQAKVSQQHAAQSHIGHPIGVFATGGHLEPPDDFLLTPEGNEHWLPGERVQTRATHGTGCALSSAFLSRLVLGDTPHQAAQSAKLYVSTALRAVTPRGSGNSSMNHLWPLVKV